VPGLDIGVQQNQVMMRVEYRDVPARGLVTTEVHSGDFEAGERGVQVGALMIPWARVHEYDWLVRQETAEAGDPTRVAARLRVRVVVDDGTPEGIVHEVPADRFESGMYAATLLIDRHVEPEAGVMVIQKLSIPWHRVVSVERFTARPDLEPEVAVVAGSPDAPVRPDVD
jgi:uncharacterized protein (UPF0248 family)